MLKKIRDKLNRYRQEKDLWNQLAWVQDVFSEDYLDKNEDRRTEILISLQFDKKQTDQELVQFLMSEEIKNRSNDPFQGCSDNLNRAGFLLADFRNPKNVDLFVKAKTSNFDTHCGFDWEHILSAGVEKTFNQIKTSPKEIREAFHSYFESKDSCELSEEDIEDWLENKRTDWYPSNFNSLDLEYLIDLSFELNDFKSAQELVDEYEKGLKTITQDSLLALKYYRGRLKDYETQIEIAEKLLDFSQNDDLKAYNFIEIAELHLKLKQTKQSWLSIKRAIALSKNLDEGRMGQIADTCIDIVNQSTKTYIFLEECYQFGISNLGYFQSLNQAKKKLEASIKMKNEPATKYFESIVIQEQSKINELMKEVQNNGYPK